MQELLFDSWEIVWYVKFSLGFALINTVIVMYQTPLISYMTNKMTINITLLGLYHLTDISWQGLTDNIPVTNHIPDCLKSHLRLANQFQISIETGDFAMITFLAIC